MNRIRSDAESSMSWPSIFTCNHPEYGIFVERGGDNMCHPMGGPMSFEKAQQLLELATFVASHRMGVTLNDVGERLGISKRTAQRILHTLEVQFPDTQASFDENGHKRWRLQTGALRDLLT